MTFLQQIGKFRIRLKYSISYRNLKILIQEVRQRRKISRSISVIGMLDNVCLKFLIGSITV